MIHVNRGKNEAGISLEEAGKLLSHRFSTAAMATTFEIFILHRGPVYSRQAAEAAFELLHELEKDLSRFRAHSDISRINNQAHRKPVRVGLATFECLQLCAEMYRKTRGAFDVRVGSLVDHWRSGGTPKTSHETSEFRKPSPEFLRLDEAHHTVQLPDPAVELDLGGIGKGYAMDRMAEMLREWSLDTALLHGGYSSALALRGPPDSEGWPITLSAPELRKEPIARLALENGAVSGSSTRKGLHIIDPRSGKPVEGKRAAWSCAPGAAMADALSTAFLVMKPVEIAEYCQNHPDTGAILFGEQEGEKPGIQRYGTWKKKPG